MEHPLPKEVRALTHLVAGGATTRDVVDRALLAMRGVVPYDLATVFRLEGRTLTALGAAGPLADDRIRQHQLDLRRFPTLSRALETRAPLALTASHHDSSEGDPYDGVLDLPHGHSCMVVPLFFGDRSLGLITLDAQVCTIYPPDQVRLAAVYGELVSLALVLADQAAALEQAHQQLREHSHQLERDAGGADVACQRLQDSRSPAMQALAAMARQVAAATLPVLIRGETGTGKELLAQAIHAWSPRADAPFVKLNCAAIPENLVESELFGHVRGAFSGAERDRRGRFQTAHGGSLLLDEIGDLPLSAQAKLLRVLQEGSFEPVGSDRSVQVDVRIIAATHVDLEAAVKAGRFRQDLYFRLAVFPLQLPPLRARPEDIVPIALEWLGGEHRRSRRGPWTLGNASRAALTGAAWPGNVRELLNSLERATILQPRGDLSPVHLGLVDAPRAPTLPVASVRLPSFEENERDYLAAVLAKSDGRLYGEGGAAALTGLKPTTLRSRLVKLGLR
jgi:transcriptional regulator with GAF, ATPase, and Fis domain